MIDEKLVAAFNQAAKDLTSEGHIALCVVLERDFLIKDAYQSISVMRGSSEALYCAFQSLVRRLYQLESTVDGEATEKILRAALEIGIKQAKERAASAAPLTALN